MESQFQYVKVQCQGSHHFKMTNILVSVKINVLGLNDVTVTNKPLVFPSLVSARTELILSLVAAAVLWF